jgi:hypothetical protein
MKQIALFNDTSYGSHFGCQRVYDNLKDGLKSCGLEVRLRFPVGKDWRKFGSRLNKLKHMDVVIVNGEGTIHHSANRPRVHVLAEIGRYVKVNFSRPVFLINCTFFENDDALYEKLNWFDGLYVRDLESKNELEKHGLEGKFCPDLTFYNRFSRRTLDRKGVCGTDSVKNNVSKKIQELCERNEWPVHPMEVPRNNEKQGLMKKTIKKWLDYDVTNSIEPEKYFNILDRYSCVVCGRYHAATLCIQGCIPFLAYPSNTPKISSLLSDIFGNTRRIITDDDVVEKKLVQFGEFSMEEKRLIDDYIQKSDRFFMSMFCDIERSTFLGE